MRTRIFSSCLVATIATAIDMKVINEMTQNYAQIQDTVVMGRLVNPEDDVHDKYSPKNIP